MKTKGILVLLILICCRFVLPATVAAAPVAEWDALLEIAGQYSWYPRPDIEKLLAAKAAEYGQSLEDYGAALRAELSGNPSTSPRIRSGDLRPGFPWRKYYHLSLAEFSLSRLRRGNPPA